MKIVISKDFSETPGGRMISQGDFSGEKFREEILKPKYMEAKEKKEKLLIDLDGGYGYGSSFLEEAFGGLIRELNKDEYKEINNILEFKSNDEPSLIVEIKKYISDAINEKEKRK